MYDQENPDCRAVPFPNSPRGTKNLVEMAQAGGCYQDNPADFVKFLGIHGMQCYGFNQNFFECEEKCPFDADSSLA